MARRIQGLSISEMSQATGSSVMRLASQSERKEHDTRTNERDSNIPNTIRRNLFAVWRSCNVTLIPGPGLQGISFRMLSALPSQP